MTGNDAAPDDDDGANKLQNYPALDSAGVAAASTTVTGTLTSGLNTTYDIDFYSNPAADVPTGYGEGEVYLGSDSVTTDLVTGVATINKTLPVVVTVGHVVTATATDPDGNTSEFSAAQTVVAVQSISGRIFEDADFSGTASDYDGGTNDAALANVDVELYDNADAYIRSTTTDGSGNYTLVAPNGTYKVRVRSATIGDSNTLPDGGFNAVCGITDPVSGVACAVAEQTWANGAAAYGGQSATADDTATDNDAGPGDTWVSVAVSGADVANVNFGFAYNLIVNTNNSGQGSLDNFIDNANAIGSANGTTANSSEFRIPVADLNRPGSPSFHRRRHCRCLRLLMPARRSTARRRRTTWATRTRCSSVPAVRLVPVTLWSRCLKCPVLR